MSQMYEIYTYIFYGGAILAGVMLALAAFLFFFLDIRAVIGDLTGRTARKAIQDIKDQNENHGKTGYVKKKKVNMSNTGNLVVDPITGKPVKPGTENAAPAPAPAPAPVAAGGETEVLTNAQPAYSGETEVLTYDSGATQPLAANAGETSVLSENVGETSVLSANMGETSVLAETRAAYSGETEVLSPQMAAPAPTPAPVAQGGFGETTVLSPSMNTPQVFEIVYDITYIHSNEVIN